MALVSNLQVFVKEIYVEENLNKLIGLKDLTGNEKQEIVQFY